MKFVCVCVAVVTLWSMGGSCSADPTAASSRAQQTLQGLLEHYWDHDPADKDIGFFFSCGQIGGQGAPANWKECSCNNPSSCLDCYRWWDAVAMESMATYGIYTNTSNHSSVPDTVFAHSPYNANYQGYSTFMDDFAWYGIAYLRVYEWLNDTKWLNHSIDIYNWVWSYGWDEPCGGFWWSTFLGEQFKDSITIVEMLHFSSKLAYMFPNNTDYSSKATKIWKWVLSFENGRGMVTEKNLVSTGALPELCCNTTTKNLHKKCYSSKLSGASYNQGLLMSAAAYMYAFSGDKHYLDTGLKVLDAVVENYTTPDGLLIDELRSYQTYVDKCWGGSGDPGGDWYSFNGIFMLHLAYFTDVLTEQGALDGDHLQKIKLLVQRTSDAAWNNSAVWPPFKVKDACDARKLPSKPTSPKFHWWWVKDVTQQVMPPDAGLYFKKTDLRCFGIESQLWDGSVGSEDICAQKCTHEKNYSKYLFAYDGYHCWTWSYNRTDHICNGSDHQYNVGVKRPVGHGSCEGKCGSDKPQQVGNGVCYCDAACTTHLDCCLDYAEECVKQDFLSCEGLCGEVQALAIQGGGYCWCFHGCNPSFTDNNSMGSCCPDYPQKCLKVMPICLDARSQGSALNLFLAHMKISELEVAKTN